MNNKIKVLAVAGAVVILALLGVTCLRSREEDLLIVPTDNDIRMSVASDEVGEGEEDASEINPKEYIDTDDTATPGEPSLSAPATSDVLATFPASSPGSAPVQEEKAELVVHVCGEVQNPGVYTLPEGSRVYEAIEEAGGFTPDACENYINLADSLADGIKVYVPSGEEISKEELQQTIESQTVETKEKKDTVGNAAKPGDDVGIQGTLKVNINTATREELMTLKGVGESKADKIIAYRDSHGGFGCIEDIMNITGIKEGMFNKIKDQITVN